MTEVQRENHKKQGNLISLNMQRILSDESIRYICSSDNVIHDKRCQSARKIPETDIIALSEFDNEMRLCPLCAEGAMVRLGAKDPENIKKYHKLFDKLNVSPRILKFMYSEYKMKTRILLDQLTVWCDDDVWKIDCQSDGSVKLLHNNYIRNEDGTRCFVNGFHEQCPITTFENAVKQIAEYRYDASTSFLHGLKANFTAPKKAPDAGTEDSSTMVMLMDKQETHRKSLFRFIVDWFKRKKKVNPEIYPGFKSVSEYGFPRNNAICIYIYKCRNGEYYWNMGRYNKTSGKFTVSFGEDSEFKIHYTKVIAWKIASPENMKVDMGVRNV